MPDEQAGQQEVPDSGPPPGGHPNDPTETYLEQPADEVTDQTVRHAAAERSGLNPPHPPDPPA